MDRQQKIHRRANSPGNYSSSSSDTRLRGGSSFLSKRSVWGLTFLVALLPELRARFPTVENSFRGDTGGRISGDKLLPWGHPLLRWHGACMPALFYQRMLSPYNHACRKIGTISSTGAGRISLLSCPVTIGRISS